MTRYVLSGFAAGALAGAYANAFGAIALLIVLGCGLVGTSLAALGFLATHVDRARLLALLGEVDR